MEDKKKEDGQGEGQSQDGQRNPDEIKVDVPKGNAYGDIPAIPVVEAVEGIRFDFNSGLRVFFPKDEKEENQRKYHLKFSDADTGLVMYDSDCNPGTIVTAVKKYYIRYRFEITRQGTGEAVFSHTLDLKDKEGAYPESLRD